MRLLLTLSGHYNLLLPFSAKITWNWPFKKSSNVFCATVIEKKLSFYTVCLNMISRKICFEPPFLAYLNHQNWFHVKSDWQEKSEISVKSTWIVRKPHSYIRLFETIFIQFDEKYKLRNLTLWLQIDEKEIENWDVIYPDAPSNPADPTSVNSNLSFCCSKVLIPSLTDLVKINLSI